jgi:hypothetical protein
MDTSSVNDETRLSVGRERRSNDPVEGSRTGFEMNTNCDGSEMSLILSSGMQVVFPESATATD